MSEAQGILPYFNVAIPPLMNVMTALVLAFTLGLGLAHLKTDALKNVALDFQEIVVKTISTVIYFRHLLEHDPLRTGIRHSQCVH